MIDQMLGTEAAQADLEASPDYERVMGMEWPRVVRERAWLSNRQVDEFVGPGPLITDNNPRTEYFLLRWLLTPDKEYVNEQRLRAAGLVPVRP
jgi:hypothetical protein